MIERDVEQRFVREVRRRITGALCLKLVSPGNAGVPDRLVLLPGGEAVFVELKRPGEKPRPLQVSVQRRIAGLGFRVYGCVDSPEAVDAVVRECACLARVGLREDGSGEAGDRG